MEKFAPAVVRIGLSLVFLWFGISQVAEPSLWFGFLPEWTKQLPISQIAFIHINSSFEILFGTLLLVGIFTRPVALLLALHMVGILTAVGYNSIGVRDFGLTLATFSIFLYGPDAFTFDVRVAKKNWDKNLTLSSDE